VQTVVRGKKDTTRYVQLVQRFRKDCVLVSRWTVYMFLK
jgi:hypothetical protein